jgi:tetratricopeptide (TPR) repeat protein
MNKLPKVNFITPLWVIASFVLLTETISAYAAINIPRFEVLVWFVIIFPILVFLGFIVILWTKPWVLYSPSEYTEKSQPREFISSLRGTSNESTTSDLIDGNLVQAVAEKDISPVDNENIDKLLDNVEKPGLGWLDYYLDSKYEKAREILLQDIEEIQDEEDFISLSGRATLLLSFYDFPSASVEGNQLIEKYPNKRAAYYWISRMYSMAKLYGDALNILKQGINRTNNNDAAILKLHSARIYLDLSDNDRAIMLFQEILNKTTDTEVRSATYRGLGEVFQRLNQIDEAINNYLQAYKCEPNDIANLEKIAKFFSDISDFKTELVIRTRIKGIAQENSSNLGLLGNCYLSLGLNSLALESYQDANKITDGKEAWIVNNIANLYNNVGFHHESVKIFQKGLEINPNNQYAHERVASAKINIENEEKKAQKILESAIQIFKSV